MAESKEELKSLLMKVNEESERAGVKLNSQKQRLWHLVPSFHANRWGTVETVRDFILVDSKITAAMKLRQHIKKQ